MSDRDRQVNVMNLYRNFEKRLEIFISQTTDRWITVSAD